MQSKPMHGQHGILKQLEDLMNRNRMKRFPQWNIMDVTVHYLTYKALRDSALADFFWHRRSFESFVAPDGEDIV